MRARFAILIAAAGLSLGGCAYGDLGFGLGYGDPYGYGYSPYGSYGYNPYGYGSSSGYGIGYGSRYGGYYGSPWGWYDNFYYPGTGYYVYDSYRRPRIWTDSQRSYWTQRVQRYQSASGTNARTSTRPNWSDFSRRSATRSSDWQAVRAQRQQARQDRRAERIQQRSARIESHSEATQSNDSGNHGRHHGHSSDPQTNDE